MSMAIIMFIVLILICLALSFGFACLFTWAFCFIAGLFGVVISFSWKLVLAIWIILGIFNSITTIKVQKG